MVGHVEDLADLDLDTALLAALANQRLLGRLPVFELAARELPHPGQVLSFRTAGEEHSAIADYDGSGNHDGGEGP